MGGVSSSCPRPNDSLTNTTTSRTAVVLFGVYQTFEAVFSDDSLTYQEQILKFFVSVLWNLLAAELVATLVGSVTTLGTGATIGLIVVLTGLNLLLVIMVNVLIDGTFNILRRALPGER